jgi:hypothetical protein
MHNQNSHVTSVISNAIKHDARFLFWIITQTENQKGISRKY